MIKIEQDIISQFLELKKSTDNDNVKCKEKIKKAFLENDELIYALHNNELSDCENDEYFGVNILPYVIIPETQTNVKHYVCYTTNFDDYPKYNNIQKYMTVKFTIMCDVRDIIEPNTGLARHDLIASIIQDRFNWSNIFGFQCKLISDKESTSDSDYATRQLIFQQTTLNSISKTTNKVTQVINSTVRR